jgi:hypothetical protein
LFNGDNWLHTKSLLMDEPGDERKAPSRKLLANRSFSIDPVDHLGDVPPRARTRGDGAVHMRETSDLIAKSKGVAATIAAAARQRVNDGLMKHPRFRANISAQTPTAKGLLEVGLDNAPRSKILAAFQAQVTGVRVKGLPKNNKQLEGQAANTTQDQMVVCRLLTCFRVAADAPAFYAAVSAMEQLAADDEAGGGDDAAAGEGDLGVEDDVAVSARRLRECTPAQADAALPDDVALLETVRDVVFTKLRGGPFAAYLLAITDVGENEKPASVDTISKQLSIFASFLQFLAATTPPCVCKCFGDSADNLLAPAETAIKLLRIAAKHHPGLATKKEINVAFDFNSLALRTFQNKVNRSVNHVPLVFTQPHINSPRACVHRLVR